MQPFTFFSFMLHLGWYPCINSEPSSVYRVIWIFSRPLHPSGFTLSNKGSRSILKKHKYPSFSHLFISIYPYFPIYTLHKQHHLLILTSLSHKTLHHSYLQPTRKQKNPRKWAWPQPLLCLYFCSYFTTHKLYYLVCISIEIGDLGKKKCTGKSYSLCYNFVCVYVCIVFHKLYYLVCISIVS